MNTIEKVEEFHLLFNAKISEKPDLSDIKTNELRINLIQEELDELKIALKENNIKEVLDALLDLRYVCDGTILALGFEAVFKNAFEEVHNSNMSKACKNEKEVELTKEKYAKENIETYSKVEDNGFLVYRLEDDKVLKSINYKPANLEQFL